MWLPSLWVASLPYVFYAIKEAIVKKTHLFVNKFFFITKDALARICM
jgi:hypothetical protein